MNCGHGLSNVIIIPSLLLGDECNKALNVKLLMLLVLFIKASLTITNTARVSSCTNP